MEVENNCIGLCFFDNDSLKPGVNGVVNFLSRVIAGSLLDRIRLERQGSPLCSLLSQVSNPDAHICGLSLYPPSFHLLGGKGFQQILFFLLCNSSFSSFLSFSLQGVFPWAGHLHLAHLRVLLLPLLHCACTSILFLKKTSFSFYSFQAIGLFRHPLNSVVVGTIGKTISYGQGCLIEQVWPTHSHMEPLAFSTPR